MKIAIDASRIANEKAGVGRYTADLIKSLLQLDRQNEYLLLGVFFRGEKAKKEIMKLYERPNVKIKYLKLPGKLKEAVWHSKAPIASKFLEDADIYLAPTFLDVIANLKIPQVVVIHDLSTFKYPEHLGEKLAPYFNKWTHEACRKATKIIAISKHTKKDIVEILKINEEKIVVIYPGVTEFPAPAAELPGKLVAKSYILSVGTVEPRKNLSGLFKAYALLPRALKEKYPLVIVGAKGWNVGPIFELVEQLNLSDKIKFLGFTTDKVLAKLYKEAAVFCYPSLYEGFGLPVTEAMHFGLPVVTSNLSSLPEAAGKAALLVNPNEPKEISSALERLLEYQDEAQKLGQQAEIWAKKFNWPDSAREVLKLFQSLVK
ncbi:MAG: glycosyltransferase family 1 protein [Patescibacteria group bacterium]|jgi:glycosyltransferase involved in cell wall biosynthesis